MTVSDSTSAALPSPSLFRSFWLAGFESASHITRAHGRIDMVTATEHDAQVLADYARLGPWGIRSVREGLRWHQIDRGGGDYDFATLMPFVAAARAQGIQVIWTLCHYGWPDDLDLFSPAFVTRFARYAAAVARFLVAETDDVPFFTPINEISYIAWAVGREGVMHPFTLGRDAEVKRQLVRAAVAGMDAVLAVTPHARFVHVDPLIHIVAPHARPDLAPVAAAAHDGQFEAWDMLAGDRHPELGGRPELLDIMGLNIYHANQWEYPGADGDARLRWEDTPRDPRWRPFHQLLHAFYARYRRPLFIAETSHFGVGRGPWLQEMADEVMAARAVGVPLEGVCLYPILDRPDWDDPAHWHHSGLWDLVPQPDGTLDRVLDEPYAAALRDAQPRLAAVGCS